jgi:BlaI family transcriptional regulator, penicillinase repressor
MKKDLDSIILTRQELHIMKVVWDRGAATVREVCDVVSQRKATAYTTILTLMGILEDKGALTHIRTGRAYIYKPLLSRQQATRNQIHDVLMRFFDGRADKMIESVLENHTSLGDQVALLRKVLEPQREHQVA